MHVILLGPCFKTGRVEAFRQHPEDAVPEGLKERPWYLDRTGDMSRISTPAFISPAQSMLTSTWRIQPAARQT